MTAARSVAPVDSPLFLPDFYPLQTGAKMLIA
jgi:hypothetical protein